MSRKGGFRRTHVADYEGASMRVNGIFPTRRLTQGLLLCVAACSPAEGGLLIGPTDGQDGNDSGTTPEADSILPSEGGPFVDVGVTEGGAPSCAAGTESIYAVDKENVLYRFDPTVPSTAAFSVVGPLGCDPQGPTPYDMSVARDGYAHVLYGSYGGFATKAFTFRVDIQNAGCDGFSWVQTGTADFWMFSMGFVSDAPGGSEETLYLVDNGATPSRLAYVEKNTGQIVPVGTLPGEGDFLGTGDAQLWGFFPELTPPAVMRIDKSNGSVLEEIAIEGLPPIGGGGWAYAFAFWGGSFYIFYAVDDIDTSTNVWKLDMDGTLTKHLADTGLRIVGAGVSTCAPVETPK